jgi:hypothetical protein
VREGKKQLGMCRVNDNLLLMGGYGPLTPTKLPQAQYMEHKRGFGWNNELFWFEPHTGECVNVQ